MSDLPIPETKGQLLAEIDRERKALQEVLARYDDEQLTRPGPEGWAIKDHLTHLTAWHWAVIEDLDGRPGEETGLSAEQFERMSEDEVNAYFQQRDAGMSAAEARLEFERSLAELQQRTEKLSDEELVRPLPDEPGRTYMSLLANNSSHHYAEHRPWIEAIAASFHPNS
ncbi:MAG TPA: DinB family protein [Dehalococcoidia bacterium]|nr:DinB family protein [Dehalococcoidia bacterium]